MKKEKPLTNTQTVLNFVATLLVCAFFLAVVIYSLPLYYKKWYRIEERKNIMSQRYSGKSRKDSSTMKKSKLSLLEKRKIKREKKKKR